MTLSKATREARDFWKRIEQINHFAEEEGWAIFDCGGYVEIQKEDCADDDDASQYVGFATDCAAIAHVKRCAKAGSALHKMALQITEDAEACKRALGENA